MNKTPRTETVVKMAAGPMREYAIIEHAQTLERELLKAREERDEAVAGLKFVANWSGGTDWPHHIIAGDILDCLNSKSKEDAE